MIASALVAGGILLPQEVNPMEMTPTLLYHRLLIGSMAPRLLLRSGIPDILQAGMPGSYILDHRTPAETEEEEKKKKKKAEEEEEE